MSLYQQQPWILTHSGKRVNLKHPRAEDVVLGDITYALARLNRFTGHADPTWTVGQHSLFCTELARLRGYSYEAQRSCLIHDFAEAYLGDVSSPLKQCIQGYHGLEVLHFAAICKALEIPVEDEWMHGRQPIVKAIDQRAFEVEIQKCMPAHPDLPEMAPVTKEEHRAWMRYYGYSSSLIQIYIKSCLEELNEAIEGVK
jgi:hypothetical protein